MVKKPDKQNQYGQSYKTIYKKRSKITCRYYEPNQLCYLQWKQDVVLQLYV